MRKHTRAVKELNGVMFKGHFLQGTEWNFTGSKYDYVATITEKGIQCDCMGFTYHGNCKHTKQIAEDLSNEN